MNAATRSYPRLEEIGVIGNCQFSALVDHLGEVVWSCLPRFDSEPVFSALLDAESGGRFRIGPADGQAGTQRYRQSTNILETTFQTATGSFRVVDFAPRFLQYERAFRPTQLVRIVEPLEGSPRIAVVCEPKLGWSKRAPEAVAGSHHIRYEGFASPLRLTTDMPLSYLGGQGFTLTERQHFILSWGTPVEEPLAPLCERFLHQTARYWQNWVKHCNIPAVHQQEVIRSALALKLHCFEDTGAVVAAMTTSIPESPGSGRTWDYRYCWLRDANYALNAFGLLGHFEEREQFVRYLLNIAGEAPGLDLSPLYRVDGSRRLEERILDEWPGYEGEGPVRIGNAAATHLQHDVYGEMVLALAPIFFDERMEAERSPAALQLVEQLARKAISLAGSPDAGIWEYRTEWKPQTFSSLMCWAGADRMARIADQHALPVAVEFRDAAAAIHEQIVAHSWNSRRSAFVGHYGGEDLDASLLQMARLRFLPADDARLASTISAITNDLTRGDWLLRYQLNDGFGTPTVAFVICTFWMVEALASIGRRGEARAVFARSLTALSRLGLFSEDYDAKTRRMWGNFPQAYSHVGLIHAAFAASPEWPEVL
ncbi:MAG: glycoside hydrolase family 15 protein [Acidobacteria bacterium]|nr:glycoside hydrolase family 15 protein [Acidobacteriota bacterium]